MYSEGPGLRAILLPEASMLKAGYKLPGVLQTFYDDVAPRWMDDNTLLARSVSLCAAAVLRDKLRHYGTIGGSHVTTDIQRSQLVSKLLHRRRHSFAARIMRPPPQASLLPRKTEQTVRYLS